LATDRHEDNNTPALGTDARSTLILLQEQQQRQQQRQRPVYTTAAVSGAWRVQLRRRYRPGKQMISVRRPATVHEPPRRWRRRRRVRPESGRQVHGQVRGTTGIGG